MKHCFRPKNILITGGMGFIGSNFIRFYLNLDQSSDFNNKMERIINLDLLTYAGSYFKLPIPSKLTEEDKYIFIQGNITDRKLVEFILEKYNIDTIIHFAAESHVDRSITHPHHFIETNIVGTFTLLESARTIWLKKNQWSKNECRFYHVSTDEIYGSCKTHDAPSFSEESAYKPRSPYSASKAASNHLVASYSNTYGLPSVISNCSNNYGPFQHKEKFIPTIINACLEQKPIPIYGDGSNIRDWLYVTDHCRAIKLILEFSEPGNEYNIGANNEISNLDLTIQICELMDHHFPRSSPYSNLIQFVKDRPGHDWRYSVNCNKLLRELKWAPNTNFKAGLLKTIQFYLNEYQSSTSFPKKQTNRTEEYEVVL